MRSAPEPNTLIAAMGRPIALILWCVAAAVFVVAVVRSVRVEWRHLPGSPPPRVEDRREHRFRNFTYSQAERMLRYLVRQAQSAQTPRDRAIALARVAAMQQERGLIEPARSAGEEALQLSANDPALRSEVRGILTKPLRLEDILPARGRDTGS